MILSFDAVEAESDVERWLLQLIDHSLGDVFTSFTRGGKILLEEGFKAAFKLEQAVVLHFLIEEASEAVTPHHERHCLVAELCPGDLWNDFLDQLVTEVLMEELENSLVTIVLVFDQHEQCLHLTFNQFVLVPVTILVVCIAHRCESNGKELRHVEVNFVKDEIEQLSLFEDEGERERVPVNSRVYLPS